MLSMRRIIITFAVILLGIYALQAVYYGGYDTRSARVLSKDPAVIAALIVPAKAQGATQPYINGMLTLRTGGIPNDRTLELLQPLINARYGVVPGADGAPTQSLTLVDHGLRAQNYVGVVALLEAGAKLWPDGAEIDEILAIGGQRYGILMHLCEEQACIDFMIWLQSAGYIQDAPLQAMEKFYDDFLDDALSITKEPTAYEPRAVSSLRDLLTQSMDLPITYRASDRAAAVAALDVYLESAR